MIQRFLISSFFMFLMLLFVAPTHALADIADFNVAYEADTKGDYVKAAKFYRKFLEETNPEEAGAMYPSAEWVLGEMYRDGKGVGKNTKEAIRLFEKAANGSDNAMKISGLFDLGRIYQDGSDINGIDLVKAANYFNRCAKLKDQTCKNMVAMDSKFPEVYVALHPEKFRLAKKESQPATLDSAINLVNNGKLREALPTILWWAKNGNGDAQYILSDFYKNAAPDIRDDDLSKGWLLKAAESGNKTAQHDLGLFYYNTSFNHETVPLALAETWLKKASAQGDIDSLNILGVIKLHPLREGVKADPDAAFHYFFEAANAGSLPALLNLGDIYYDGIWGVPSDKEKAKKLYMQAADAGLTDAYLVLYKKYNIDYKKKSISTTDIMNYLRSLWPDDKGKTDIEKIKIQDNPTSKLADTASPKIPETAPPKTVDTTVPKVEDTTLPKADIATPKVASSAMSPAEIYVADSKSVMKLIAAQNVNADSLNQGSAVAITTSKAITNCHVVNKMGVILARVNGKPQEFQISSSDVGRDICIIAISEKSESLHPISETRSYDDLKVGEKVYAIGSPQGLENTLSEGIISGLRDDNGKKLIQVTAPFTHGSSGGALIDENGKLIGITSGMLDGEGNLNFAIPVDVALGILLAKN